MKPIIILDIILLILPIYIIYIHGYILARKKFKCLRCGKCCKLKVKLSPEDITKIKKLGHRNFIDEKGYLKKVNGNCIFIKTNKDKTTSCTLENRAKPTICKNFPVYFGKFGKKHDFRCRSFYSN